jgi:integrase
LQNGKNVLNRFAAYVTSKKSLHITNQLALEFATQNHNSSPHQWCVTLGIIRRFATHLRMIDPHTEVPPPDLLPPHSYHRRSPYIYSTSDISKLLNACNNLLTQDPLDAQTYYTLFGLIAVTGMRTGEALALGRESVDFKLGIITIRESKFRKSRKIPIHISAVKKLLIYATARDRYFGKPRSSYFFVNKQGTGLKPPSVYSVFNKVCLEVGLRKKGKPGGPRIVDLRHTMAVNTLIRCYEDGLNTDVMIPALSTYLGHENPVNTYWYFTGTPELLNLINIRLEKQFGGKRDETN